MHCAYVTEFHERLQQARKRRYATATEAAEAMHIAPATYLAHENGSRGGEKSAVRYAQFFRVDYRWLLTGAGTMDGSPVQRLYDELPENEQKEAVTFLEYLKSRSKRA